MKYENILTQEERTNLLKMGVFSMERDGKIEQFLPLSQYLKAIYVIEKLEQESTKLNIPKWTSLTEFSQSVFHYTSSFSSECVYTSNLENARLNNLTHFTSSF